MASVGALPPPRSGSVSPTPSEAPATLEFNPSELAEQQQKKSKSRRARKDDSSSSSDSDEGSSDVDSDDKSAGSSDSDYDSEEEEGEEFSSHESSDDEEAGAAGDGGGGGEKGKKKLMDLLRYDHGIPGKWTTTAFPLGKEEDDGHLSLYDTDEPFGTSKEEFQKYYERCVAWNGDTQPDTIYREALKNKKAVALASEPRHFATNWQWHIDPSEMRSAQTAHFNVRSPLPDGTPLQTLSDFSIRNHHKIPLVPHKGIELSAKNDDDELILPLGLSLLGARNTLPVKLNLELETPFLEPNPPDSRGFVTVAGGENESSSHVAELEPNSNGENHQTLLQAHDSDELLSNPEFMRWAAITPLHVEKSIRRSKTGTSVVPEVRSLTSEERSGWVQASRQKHQLMLGAPLLVDETNPDAPVELKQLSKKEAKKIIAKKKKEERKQRRKKRKEVPLEEQARLVRVKTGKELLVVPLLPAASELAQVIATGYAHAIVRQCVLEGTDFKLVDSEDKSHSMLVMHLRTFMNVVRRYCALYDLRKFIADMRTMRFVARADHRTTLPNYAQYEPSRPTALEAHFEMRYVRLPLNWCKDWCEDVIPEEIREAALLRGKCAQAELAIAIKAEEQLMENALAEQALVRGVAQIARIRQLQEKAKEEVRATHAHHMPQPADPKGALTRF